MLPLSCCPPLSPHLNPGLSQWAQADTGSLPGLCPGHCTQPQSLWELVVPSLNNFPQPHGNQLPWRLGTFPGVQMAALSHLPKAGTDSVVRFMFQCSPGNQAEESPEESMSASLLNFLRLTCPVPHSPCPTHTHPVNHLSRNLPSRLSSRDSSQSRKPCIIHSQSASPLASCEPQPIVAWISASPRTWYLVINPFLFKLNIADSVACN